MEVSAEPTTTDYRLDALLAAGRWPGLGIFLGCVGKSAQFPLHVWLPDAMEGPTPVSALIHAATMVAAGVYLVGRCLSAVHAAKCCWSIAYIGGITLFVAATIAVVMTDIKKVLAYSTVSQLGYMMLALGVGGWVAGLFHLITHAFFKALLFLGSGSVIYGCHHEQDMRKMGGLFRKMKITALTMLVGVLAIAGMPLSAAGTARTRSWRRRWASPRPPAAPPAVPAAAGHGGHDHVLHVPHVVPDLHRQAARRARSRARPRVAVADDGAADRPGGLQRRASPGAGRSGTPSASWLEHNGPLTPSIKQCWPTSATASREVEATTRICRPSPRIGTLTNVCIGLTTNHHLAGILALVAGGHRLRLRRTRSTTTRVLDPAEAKEQFPGVHRFPVAQVVLRRAVQRHAGAAGAGGRPLVRSGSTCTSSTASFTASPG